MSRFGQQNSQKRILSDNTLMYNNRPLPSKKQKTIEFQSVSIKPSSLPRPQNKQEVNQDQSNIPGAPNISPSKSLKGIKHIMSMQGRLKEPVRLPTPKLEEPIKNEKSSAPISVDLIIDLSQELVTSQSEYQELVRSYKKYISKVDETTNKLKTQKWKYQTTVDLMLKETAKDESLVNDEIESFQQELNQNFLQTEAQLIKDLNKAKNFNDELILQEILTVQKELDSLLEKLEHLEVEHEQNFTSAKRKFENELSITLQPKVDEINKLANEFDTQQKKNTELVKKLANAEEDISSNQSRKEHLQKSIKQLDFNFENFENSKSQILLDLHNIEKDLEATNVLKTRCDEQFDVEHWKFLHTQNKLKNYNYQRQILENSIMDYENKVRVYIMGRENLDNYQFNKVFPPSQPNIPNEFSALVKSALRGFNISVIFNGEMPIIMSSITKSCETLLNASDESIYLTLQSLTFSNSKVYDSLDNHKEVSSDRVHGTSLQFNSQQMKIDKSTFNEIAGILNPQPTNAGINIHIFNVKTNQTTSSIIFLDLCGKSIKHQVVDLERFIEICTNRTKPVSLEDKLFLFAFKKSICLFLANIENIESQELLSCLSRINRLKTPYSKS